MRAKVRKKDIIQQLPAFQCKKMQFIYSFWFIFASFMYENAEVVPKF